MPAGKTAKPKQVPTGRHQVVAFDTSQVTVG
jgi:hypothetical protein